MIGFCLQNFKSSQFWSGFGTLYSLLSRCCTSLHSHGCRKEDTRDERGGTLISVWLIAQPSSGWFCSSFPAKTTWIICDCPFSSPICGDFTSFFFFLWGRGSTEARELGGKLEFLQHSDSSKKSDITLYTTFSQVHSVAGNDPHQQSITQSSSTEKGHCNLISTLCKCNYQHQFVYASNFHQEASLLNRGWK